MNDSLPPDETPPGVSRKSGLPPISPDAVEQEQGAKFEDGATTRGEQMLPIVGLGGSAGSIPALQRFFAAMPADSGMAFVVVLHLATDHESILDEILARSTAMPVLQASDGQKVEANTVYVIPPGSFLTTDKGRLRLAPLGQDRGKRMAVDLFFRSLADSQGPDAVAIVLSGADGDGALGIKRIKEWGGLTIAQMPEEAQHPSMPHTAIDTKMVDWILPVAEMPARLMEYRATGARLKLPADEAPAAQQPVEAGDVDETALRNVLGHLRLKTGRDFSYYKRPTVLRRIARRMQVNAVSTIPEYWAFLRAHPGETGALLQDLLISVTNFFRDREAFEALEAELPRVFIGKGAGDAVRVWTAGCATGEEAYSVAMMLLEQAGQLDAPPVIQVFATDLAEDAIAAAREGLYPVTIHADVSEERLERFFTREHRGYRAKRELRECVLFAVHDVLKDPPFGRMDLVTCRNLLIYLTAEAQKRVYTTAHYSLRPGGLLFIGSSESAEEESGRWAPLHQKHRIYQQRPGLRPEVPVPIGPSTLSRAFAAQERAQGGPYILAAAFAHQSAALPPMAADQETRKVSWEELHFKLIERLSPPSLIVTRDYDIVHVSQNAGRFLHFNSGQPSVNLLKVVQPMLRIELRAALFRAAQTNVPVEVFRQPVEIGKETLLVDIRVTPAPDIAPDYLLVVFAVREPGESLSVQARQEAEPAARLLERENEDLKRRLRDTVEQYETVLEEQKAGAEELLAMNEELRSGAEELETSREELQSVNEELTTVNAELKSRVDDLGRANGDLANLMAASGVATLFLDRTLVTTRYTPSAMALFRLIPTDLGRPLTDLRHRLIYPELKDDAEQVLKTLEPVKREVTDGQGWYLAQMLAYQGPKDPSAGLVLTLTDITETRRAEQALRTSELRLRTLADAVPQIIWTNDAAGRANYFNYRWYDYSGLTFEQSAGRGWQAMVHQEDEQASTARWAEALTAGAVFDTEYRLRAADGKYRWFIGRNVPMRDAEGEVSGWFGTATDIQDLKETAAALQASEQFVRATLDSFSSMISIIDRSGVILDVNEAWRQFARENALAAPNFCIGQNYLEITRRSALAAPGESPGVLRGLEGVLSGEAASFTYEYPCHSPHRERWFMVSISPLAMPGGGAVIWHTDITDRKQAENAVAASEEQFRRALEDAPIPVMMHAEDGEVLQLSNAWSDLTGYEARDLLTYQDWLEKAFGSGADTMREEMLGVFRGNRRRVDAEMEVMTRHGGVRRWSFSASAPGSLRDGRRFIVTMAVDITERARAEEALRESQERLRLIVENAREYAIFSMDLDRRITSWNRGATVILQYTHEEAIGQSGDIIFTPEDRAQHAPEREARGAIADGRAADERWHLRKDGSRFWGSGVMMAMHDAHGQAIGLVKIFRDHTAQLRATEALEKSQAELWEALGEADKARAEAEAAGKAKDHFLAVLSHELRTPLTPVLMATQSLARRTDLPDRVQEALAMIRRNIQIESRFVDELLDITKIERGKMELVREPMDVHTAIEHAVEVSRPDMEAKAQELIVALEAPAHELTGDFSRLQQVVWNLLKNASKFTPDGGAIRLHTRNEAGALVIEITDSGIGLEPEAAARIFDPFTQADAAITREYGGLGLGLAIAKASVLGHGGEIRVESPGAGRGATFIVTLPLMTTERAE